MRKNNQWIISLSLTLASVWGAGINLGLAATTATHSSLFDTVSVRYNTVVEGKDFPYYTQAMRIQTMTDLARSIQSDYSLLLYKQHTLGVDAVQLGDAALAVESSLPDVYDESTQAQGNMEFLDRARKLTATFKDSHFQLDGAQPTSEVALGIGVAKIGGKIIVTSLRKPLLKDQTTLKDYNNEVALGDELVSIDGVSAEDQAQALETYLPASSDGFREMLAIGSITARDFQLPEKGIANVVLNRNGSSISLPLPWYSLSTVRTDQATLFKNRGITIVSEDTVGKIEGLDKPVGLGTLFMNAQWRTTIKDLQAEEDFNDLANPDTTVVKFGIISGATGPVGFLQIQSFDVETLVDAASMKNTPATTTTKMVNGKPVKVTTPAKSADPMIVKFPDLMNAVGNLVKKHNVPLIIDLRNNPGGNPDFAASVLSAIAPAKASYAPLSTMYRITNLAWETQDASTPKGLTDPKKIAIQDAADAAFKNAIAEGKPYTEVLPGDAITAAADVGGYDKSVVALTSPNCVSACDIMSMLLKDSGRAKLLGTPSNGTGAGFSSAFDVPSFTDTNHILTARVPNMLFGRPLRAGESAATIDVESIESENRPTQPDVVYQQDLNDVISGNTDLIQAAIKAL